MAELSSPSVGKVKRSFAEPCLGRAEWLTAANHTLRMDALRRMIYKSCHVLTTPKTYILVSSHSPGTLRVNRAPLIFGSLLQTDTLREGVPLSSRLGFISHDSNIQLV